MIQTILNGLGPLILQDNELSPVEDERLRILSTVLTSISQSLHEQEKAFDSFLSDMKVKVISMKNGLSRTKHGIDKIITDITNSGPLAQPENSANGAAPAAVSSDQSIEIIKKQRKCGKCGGSGHIKRNCPN